MMLELRAVHAHYGHIHALHGVDLAVQVGEVVTLIGANGAGKSTLMMSLFGLPRASAGRVIFDGEDITGLPAHAIARRGIALVPEGRRIFPRMTVMENLQMGAALSDALNFDVDLKRMCALFPILGERRHQRAGTLSGGEQQMLAMGRAMMVDPVLLIADEVSLGLAPIVVERIFDVMVEMNRRGRAVLLAEQDVAIALEAASRAYVLDTGSIALQGRAIDLLDDPRIVSAYLQEV
jgi:branched-chain amino acid transport system ATP-binding protein